MKIGLNTKNYIELNLKDLNQRDLVLIFPGGAYLYTSNREGEPVSDLFLADGYHTAIYYYRETLLIYPEILAEGEHVLKLLKENPLVNRIFLIGFSAGGHLAGLLMTRNSELVSATILAYPVITSNPKFFHESSIKNLLGHEITQAKLDEVSIEKHITPQVSPVFIMHTADDKSVPVENSLLLIDALRLNHVPIEFHLYQTGRHGLSIASRNVAFDDMDSDDFVTKYGYISGWIELAKNFIKRV